MKQFLFHNGRLSSKRLASALKWLSYVRPPEEQPGILIRFGNTKGDDGSILTLNKKNMIIRASSRAIYEHFRLYRVSATSQSGSSGNTVLVYVIDGQVLGINAKRSLTQTEKERLGGAAVRALYLSGLDFGAVKLSSSFRSRPNVVSILTAPPLSKEMSTVFADRLEETIDNRLRMTALSKEEDTSKKGASFRHYSVLVGADPEFMLRSSKSGKMIPASRFFLKDGKIGCDQRRAIGELRPSPKSSPRDLTKGIGELIKGLSLKLKNKSVSVVAGSQPFKQFPIGGHIHFGGIQLNHHIIRVLDTYFMIPLFLIERASTSIQRRKYYGNLADIRPKGPRRFEYRTPGSWLVSPKITLAAVTLAKLVVENNEYLHFDAFANPEAVAAFYAGHKGFFYPLVPFLRRDIQQLPTFTSMMEKDLKPLWDLIEHHDEWDENVDLRKAWRSDNFGENPE